MKNTLHTLAWVNLFAVAVLFSCNKSDNAVREKLPDAIAVTGTDGTVIGDDLIWSDEFNTAGTFDTNKWKYINRGTSHYSKFLTSLPAYVSSDGNDMVLRMDAATIAGDNVPYHTGGIETKNKFFFTYGMVEVRMKFDEGNGSWPAFWIIPQLLPYGGWPACGEVDVAEHFNSSNQTQQNIYSLNTNVKKTSTHIKNAYNTWVVIWTPTAIRFFLNGKFTSAVNRPANHTWQSWPFDQPWYIILNQSGGAGSASTVDHSKLPYFTRVDYVRVYQAPNYLFNGGFEYSQALTPWAVWQPAGSTVSLVSTDANSGTKAIRLQGGECSAEQLITGLEPNTTYILKGYGKKSVTGVSASIGVKNYGGGSMGDLITTTSYQQRSVTFTTGASNTSAVIYVYKSSANGTVYADDFELVKQ